MPSVNTFTKFFRFEKPYLNKPLWISEYHGFLDTLDAILNKYIIVNNVQGVWQNATAYTINQTVVDTTDGQLYTAVVNHNSANPPTTFAEDRLAHPSYWTNATIGAHGRGQWLPNTLYNVGDFVSDGLIFAVAITQHTSGTDFAADAVYWDYIVDVTDIAFYYVAEDSTPLDVPPVATQTKSFVVGEGNAATGVGEAGVVLGGKNNLLTGSGFGSSYSVMIGGESNTINGGDDNEIIIGGENNAINAQGDNNLIIGGSGNEIDSLCGGTNTVINSEFMLVTNGTRDCSMLSSSSSTVDSCTDAVFIGVNSADYLNIDNSIIFGGNNATIDGASNSIIYFNQGPGDTIVAEDLDGALVIVHDTHVDSLNYAMVIGQENTITAGVFADVMGQQINAGNLAYTSVRGEGHTVGSRNFTDVLGRDTAPTFNYNKVRGAKSFGARKGDSQKQSVLLQAKSVGTTPVELSVGDFTDTTTKLVLPNNTAWGYTLSITGKQTNGSSVFFAVHGGRISRGANAASTAFIGSISTPINQSPGYAIAHTADTVNGALVLTITGLAGHNVNWFGELEIFEVGQ